MVDKAISEIADKLYCQGNGNNDKVQGDEKYEGFHKGKFA